jgi:hypothetical protein
VKPKKAKLDTERGSWSEMSIDWESIARQVGGIGPDGQDRIVGTIGGRQAVQILLGEENLRSAVDCCVSQSPGNFTAEMVLKVIRSTIAMEYCYKIFKTEQDREKANSAVFLLASFADTEALPWIREFLNDGEEIIRWNGLMVLQCILYGPVGDAGIATAKEALDKADSDTNPRLRELAKRVRPQLERFEMGL